MLSLPESRANRGQRPEENEGTYGNGTRLENRNVRSKRERPIAKDATIISASSAALKSESMIATDRNQHHSDERFPLGRQGFPVRLLTAYRHSRRTRPKRRDCSATSRRWVLRFARAGSFKGVGSIRADSPALLAARPPSPADSARSTEPAVTPRALASCASRGSNKTAPSAPWSPRRPPSTG